MKKPQTQHAQTSAAMEDLEEIPKALGFKDLEKMMTEPPELTTEEVVAIAKLAISMIH